MVDGRVANILICSIPASGHLHPALALAAELQRGGHEVRLAAVPQDAAPAQAAGVTCLFLNDQGQPSAWISRNDRWLAGLREFQPLPAFAAGLTIAAAAAALGPWLPALAATSLGTPVAKAAGAGLAMAMAAMAHFFAHGFPRTGVMVDRYVLETFLNFAPRHFEMLERTPAVDEFSPDLVVVDALAYGAALWCDRHDRPWVSLSMFPGALCASCDPPYTGHGLPPLGPAGPLWRKWQYRAMNWWIESLSRWLATALRRRLQRDPRLAPFVDGLHLERLNCVADRLTLCFTHPYLEYGREEGWPSSVRLTGPALFDGHGAADEPWLQAIGERIDAARLQGRKIVYVTFGTIWLNRKPRLFAKIVSALARADDFFVVATTGDATAAARVQAAAPAALVFRSVPNSWLIPQIDIMVHHCGFNTALEPAILGKPSAVVPVGVIDNSENAARLSHIGVARRVPAWLRWLPGRRFDRRMADFLRAILADWERDRGAESHPHRRLLAALNASERGLGDLRGAGARQAVDAIESLLRELQGEARPSAVGAAPSSLRP